MGLDHAQAVWTALNGPAGFKSIWMALKWAAGFKLVLNTYMGGVDKSDQFCKRQFVTERHWSYTNVAAVYASNCNISWHPIITENELLQIISTYGKEKREERFLDWQVALMAGSNIVVNTISTGETITLFGDTFICLLSIVEQQQQVVYMYVTTN